MSDPSRGYESSQLFGVSTENVTDVLLPDGVWHPVYDSSCKASNQFNQFGILSLGEQIIAGPLTSILAVKADPPAPGQP